ncbi:16S rRNA (uracil(1498)-N(3))-methyltransferase [Desulfuromonas sp. AOP6]|uniref:16S rRNA (uracil(1498)-N(3))-methyltransferase n=1 Tax=Desulfuromonas sp. AOP6 TaxID=1566351 RepID=UPI0012739267|nr:16S rRNA (uracil(1498)-N(3))-methyltransferase [Desulfuromonas sp. AOP6]BCA80717.1 ribosomal RNA small subunit methyltransferase E [Desulfuromonas sp. AOP6]
MNLILLFEEDFISSDIVRLSGRRQQHIREIHRAGEGDTLCVGLAGGDIGHGQILNLKDRLVEMRVSFERQPPPKLPLTLVLALPRPKALKRILIAATSLGVEEIHLIHSWRVEKSFWHSDLLKPEALQEPLILGLEQAKDTHLPSIELHRLFKPFAQDILPGLSANSQRLVAHPVAESPCPRNVGERTTLAIGPEGGFLPYEVELLAAAGFKPVHCGPRILRVETAVPALISRLS